MREFKEAIIAKRKTLGLSVYKLCVGWDLGSWGAYADLEKKGNPTLKTMLKISKALDLEFTIKNGEIVIR
jgi:DNA-binding phage protein